MSIRLPIVFLASLLCALSVPTSAAQRPVTGGADPAFEGVDKAVQEFMDTIDATSATVAVCSDGKTVYSHGFGWQDQKKAVPTPPDALMRVASVSKPVTSALIHDLIADGRLKLADKAFPLINLKPPAGATPDPRLATITVDQLLQHKGGFDRAAGDPMFQVRKIEKALDLKWPARPMDVVRYMLGQPLQFDPGSKSVYSNFGYCALGRVIERVTGRPYADVLKKDLCDRLKIADLKVGRTATAERDPREVWYPIPDNAFSLDVMDAHGGLIASAPALGQFMGSYWISGDRRPAGARGRAYAFFGSLPGTTAMIVQRPDGTDVAVLLNARRDRSFDEDNGVLRKTVMAAVDAVPAESRRAK